MSVTVPVEFLADFSKSLKEFSSFQAQTADKIGQIQSGFEGLGTVLKAAGVAFVAKQIVDGLKNVIDAAADAEVSANKMRNSLKLAGDFSERNAKQFEKFAEGIQAVTVYDDDLILSQVAVAKQFGATNIEAQKLIEAAVDLAAATDTDLNSAVLLLGKSLDGTAGKLNELVPGMRKLTAEQLAAGGAIELVANRFRGAASAAAGTYKGSIEQAQNAIGNLKESLGNMFIQNEAVIRSIKSFSEFVTKLNNDGDLQQLVGTVLAFGGSIVTLIVILKNAATAFVALQTAAVALKISMAAVLGPIGLVILAVSTLAGLIAYSSLSNNKAATSMGILEKKYDDTLKSVENLKEAIKNNSDPLVTMAYQRSLDKQEIALSAITEQLMKQSQIEKQKAKSSDETADGFDKQKSAIERVSSELQAQFKTIKTALQDAGKSDVEVIENRYQREIELIQKAIRYNVTSNADAQKVIASLTMKYDKDVAEARKKEREERLAEEMKFLTKLTDLQSNPIKIFFDENSLNNGAAQLSKGIREGLSAGIGALAQVLNGREGALNIISAGAEAAGKAIFGVPGIGEIVKLLAQGPEKVKEMVKEFAEAVPDIIVAIVEAIPVVIEALAEKFGDPAFISRLGQAFIKATYVLPFALNKALLKGVYTIVTGLGKAAINFMGKLLSGAGQFVSKILQGAVNFIGEIIKGAGKFVEKLISSITGSGGSNGFLGTGLGKGPGGIVGTVLSGGVTDAIGIIKKWFKGGAEGESMEMPQIASKSSLNISSKGGTDISTPVQNVQTPQSINVSVQIDRREIAKALVDLNRLGYRTVAV